MFLIFYKDLQNMRKGSNFVGIKQKTNAKNKRTKQPYICDYYNRLKIMLMTLHLPRLTSCLAMIV